MSDGRETACGGYPALKPSVVVTSPWNRSSLALRAPLLYRGASILQEDEPTWRQLGPLSAW